MQRESVAIWINLASWTSQVTLFNVLLELRSITFTPSLPSTNFVILSGKAIKLSRMICSAWTSDAPYCSLFHYLLNAYRFFSGHICPIILLSIDIRLTWQWFLGLPLINLLGRPVLHLVSFTATVVPQLPACFCTDPPLLLGDIPCYVTWIAIVLFLDPPHPDAPTTKALWHGITGS